MEILRVLPNMNSINKPVSEGVALRTRLAIPDFKELVRNKTQWLAGPKGYSEARKVK